MLNLIDLIPWNEYRDFFASGHPPVILRLIFINTIFLMVWVVRRARGATAWRSQTSVALQIILLIANFFAMTSSDIGGI